MKLLHLWGLSATVVPSCSQDLSCQLVSSALKFCLQIPDGHNQNQTGLTSDLPLWQAPSLTAISRQEKKEIGKSWNLLEFPITWNWFSCDHKGFYLVQQSPGFPQQLWLSTHLTTSEPNTGIFLQSPRQEKCNSCTEKASIFCNKKCHLKVHRNLLELVAGRSGEDFVSTFHSTFII